MQTKFIFILLQLYCLLFFSISFINGHLSYKYRNRNRSRGSLHNTHTAQALVLAESTSSSFSLSSSNLNNHQSQIECDFLNHKETGCEDEIGSRCDPNTTKCVCKESHPVRLLDFCLKISRLNGPCYTSGQCSSVIANASCYIFGKEYDLDSHNLGRLVTKWPLGVCKCRLGFAYNITTNNCEKRIIGSWCSSDKHCWTIRSLNSICDKKRGECECAWGTRYESKLDTCVPDTSVNSLSNNGINHPNRQVFYMSKCEQDTDCSPTSTSSIQTTSLSSGDSLSSSTNSPSLAIHPTVSSTNSPSSASPISISSSTSSPIVSSNLIHQPSAQIENNNLLLEQADQENQFSPIRYLHGHRRFKDGLKRLTNYHLRELKCIRGRCMCPSLHSWDGSIHCREYYDVQSNSSHHRHNRKNHNTFTDLDDELNDELDEDSSVNWQTICLLILGTCMFAGFIFRFCYIRKCEDDELSEGLRSPDGLYAHKPALNREHPFNSVTVAFLSKPNPTAMNGASCGSNHFDPGYGYITSAAPGCYHEFDYGYGMCNGAVVAHSMMPPTVGQMPRGHLQTVNNNSSLGKPPNEEDEDAYLEQNPEERENFEKKARLIDSNDGCVQCGQIRINNGVNLNVNHSAAEIPTSRCCAGCDCTNSLINKDGKLDTTLTRAILEQYAGNESVAGDSLNSTVGLRDVNGGCLTSATTTTTCDNTTSSGNTTNEEDDDNNKSTIESKSDYIESDLKDEHLSSLLSQATNNLQTSFIKQVSTDLGSEEDSNEDTSDEHVAILNRKPRKDVPKKWRSSSSSSSVEAATNSLTISNNKPTNNSPSKNKSNVPLLLESQTEQFQIV